MFVSSITTVSINEGLDFACHLLSDAISDKGSSSQEETIRLLRALSSFIQFRYVGETLLALEELVAIGIICSDSDFSCLDKEATVLFWTQIKWLASQMELPEEQGRNLEFLVEKFT